MYSLDVQGEVLINTGQSGKMKHQTLYGTMPWMSCVVSLTISGAVTIFAVERTQAPVLAVLLSNDSSELQSSDHICTWQ